jgi:hypothetical protein
MHLEHALFDQLGGWDAMGMTGPTDPITFEAGFPVRVKLPGRELPPDFVQQFDESKPAIFVEDYDLIIKMGWNAWFGQYLLPRLHPEWAGPEGMARMGARMGQFTQDAAENVQYWKKRGIPILVGGMFSHPFEQLCWGRSLHEFYIDMFRMPDKVLAAIDRYLPEAIEAAIGMAKGAGVPFIFVGGTRGSSAMLRPAQFEKFWFPVLKKAVAAFDQAGITTLLHFDSDWTGFLPYFKELPKGKCILELDSATDIFKAKEVLRGHLCIMGDVPATLFKLGTPEQVTAYVKRLIDEVGGDGGFILSTGCDTPADAKWENFKAMIETGKTYELSK